MAILGKTIQCYRHIRSFGYRYPTLQKHAESSSIQAFSTIELMITIVIMGLMASFSASNLSRWLSVARIQTAANNLALDLKMGRIRAISENTLYRITFDTSANSFQIHKYNAGNWQDVTPLQPLPPGIDLETVTTNPIYFQTLGNVAAAGTITLHNFQDQRRSVAVSRSGRVTVKKIP
jgi:Tfp pilus assembly protein FimT